MPCILDFYQTWFKRVFFQSDWEQFPAQLGRNFSNTIVWKLHYSYRGCMDTIERDLLYRIITDRPFAEYITQWIDIGDFDDEVANRIYDGIVDLLYRRDKISFEVLIECFREERNVRRALEKIVRYDETTQRSQERT